MKLYSILLSHCAPKDCKKSIVGFFIAENDFIICNHINKEFMFGIWSDRHDDSLTSPIKIYNDDFKVIGSEFYMERMMRLRGEYNDPDADFSDAYYGLSFYGWSEGVNINKEQIDTLVSLGVAVLLV